MFDARFRLIGVTDVSRRPLDLLVRLTGTTTVPQPPHASSMLQM